VDRAFANEDELVRSCREQVCRAHAMLSVALVNRKTAAELCKEASKMFAVAAGARADTARLTRVVGYVHAARR
jgi:hypothetical protein